MILTMASSNTEQIPINELITAKKSPTPFKFVPFALHLHRVAELGSLSSGAKMAMQIFVKRVFTIFATNASFLCVITNLQI